MCHRKSLGLPPAHGQSAGVTLLALPVSICTKALRPPAHLPLSEIPRDTRITRIRASRFMAAQKPLIQPHRTGEARPTTRAPAIAGCRTRSPECESTPPHPLEPETPSQLGVCSARARWPSAWPPSGSISERSNRVVHARAATEHKRSLPVHSTPTLTSRPVGCTGRHQA
jgi:hypothetical protein